MQKWQQVLSKFFPLLSCLYLLLYTLRFTASYGFYNNLKNKRRNKNQPALGSPTSAVLKRALPKCPILLLELSFLQ